VPIRLCGASGVNDPATAPNGGESVLALCQRIGHWLDHLPKDMGRTLAVTPPAVACAAVLHALAAPAQAFWRIDIPHWHASTSPGERVSGTSECGSEMSQNLGSETAIQGQRFA